MGLIFQRFAAGIVKNDLAILQGHNILYYHYSQG